jgi:excisionase family DNA binding protein
MSIASTGASDWEKDHSGLGRAAYSVSETAAQLGVSEASVWRALKRHQLDSIMFGGRRLVTARSIEKLLSAKAA